LLSSSQSGESVEGLLPHEDAADADGDFALLEFELSRARLDKQERVLEELRSRTGVLLAASSLAASFLGQEAFGNAGWGILPVVAVASFLVSMAASVYVLLPKKGLVFSLVGSAVFERLFAVEGGMPEVHRRLAYDLDRFWEENDKKMRRLLRSFQLAASALVVEILALVALIVDTLS
jgi:hypothetical protein